LALVRCTRSVKVLYEFTNERNGQWSPLVSKDTYETVMKARWRPALALLRSSLCGDL
jgi:Na+-transporting NADH:ubiquinone oxidoreductase subunit NqrA